MVAGELRRAFRQKPVRNSAEITSLTRAVFGHRMIDETTAPSTIPLSDVYRATRVSATCGTADCLVIELERPVTNHTILDVRRQDYPTSEDSGYLLGHPFAFTSARRPPWRASSRRCTPTAVQSLDAPDEGAYVPSMRTLLWFRGKDLRVHDHAALHAAAKDSRELLPVFVLSKKYFGDAPPVEAPHRVQFLLASLRELVAELADRGSTLHVVDGPAEAVIVELAERLKVDRVLAIAAREPAARARDERIALELKVPFVRIGQEQLIDPETVRTGSKSAFRVYTPFARAAREHLHDVKVFSAPKQLPPVPQALKLKTVPVPELERLNPRIQQGGERAARERLKRFLAGPVKDYPVERDRMDRQGTSRLSADLHFGTLSPGSVWSALANKPNVADEPRQRYSGELLWREFAHYTLWHWPSVLNDPFRPEFKGFPWRRDAAAYEAWWRGTTGYPIVDASARQLLEEGFVHNRARMISASFLCKHLLVSYQRGEAHYLQYLTDGDLAQNNMGWQWSAGCGCDAQPYFRVFNPVTQGQRFDPHGDYVRRYLPELARLPPRYIHSPWTAPPEILAKAGVRLGQSYPEPIVEHTSARKRFLLVASEHLKATGAGSRPSLGE